MIAIDDKRLNATRAGSIETVDFLARGLEAATLDVVYCMHAVRSLDRRSTEICPSEQLIIEFMRVDVDRLLNFVSRVRLLHPRPPPASSSCLGR